MAPVKDRREVSSGVSTGVEITGAYEKLGAQDCLTDKSGRREFLGQTTALLAGALAGGWALTRPESATANPLRVRSAPNIWPSSGSRLGNDRVHYFHADTSALGGYIEGPNERAIPVQASLSLSPSGGHASARAENFELEGVLSYESAATEVSGRPSDQKGGGWITLATAVVEGLNVLDMITVDRLTAQISTEHPLMGDNPSVTFAGTSFENLKISGYPVDVRTGLDICNQGDVGEFPNQAYVNDQRFLARVADQYQRMNDADNLPEWVKDRSVPDWIKERYALDRGQTIPVICSLVKQTDGKFPGRPFGNVLEVPGLGRVFLGELLVYPQYFHLSMLRVELKGRVRGNVGAGSMTANGVTFPPS